MSAYVSDVHRSRQLRRTWLVIAILRGRAGATLEYLASETGVSKRTIRRDLIALEDAGLPLSRTNEDGATEHGTGWRLLKGSPCPICNRGIATGKEYREAHSLREAMCR